MKTTRYYQTCSLLDLFSYIDDLNRRMATTLNDSPVSRKGGIAQNIGFFRGICEMRGFDYSYEHHIQPWEQLACEPVKEDTKIRWTKIKNNI